MPACCRFSSTWCSQCEGNAAAAEELARHTEVPEEMVALARDMIDSDLVSAGHRIRVAADSEVHSISAAFLRLAAGERFRRAGERRLAREQLRAALDVFSAAGAEPWVRRAQAELRASGATLRRDADGQPLTPSELRVATLVAEGNTNKEVASALFLSPKTVEFHLGRAYRKLGVTNRTALARALIER
jgi:DNA-binding NarL/FixJ family response regulator